MNQLRVYTLSEYLNNVLDIDIIYTLFLYSFVFLLTWFCCIVYRKNIKFGSQKNNFVWLIFSILPMVLLYGFRHKVGTDYDNYVSFYKIACKTDSICEYLNKLRYESLYLLINYWFSRITEEHVFCFLFIGFIISFFILIGIYKFKDKLILSLSLFMYFIDLFFYSTNGVRFSLACSLIFIGFYYLYNRKYWSYIFIVLLASLFHKTALLAIVFILLSHFERPRINKIRNIISLLLIFTFPIYLLPLLNSLENIPILSYYFLKYKHLLSNQIIYGFGILRISPVFIILLLGYKKILKLNPKNELFINLILWQIPFFYASYYIRWIGRFQRFSNMASILIISMLFSNLKKNNNRLLLLFIWVAYLLVNFVYSYVLAGSSNILPYKSIFSTLY